MVVISAGKKTALTRLTWLASLPAWPNCVHWSVSLVLEEFWTLYDQVGNLGRPAKPAYGIQYERQVNLLKLTFYSCAPVSTVPHMGHLGYNILNLPVKWLNQHTLARSDWETN